MKGSSNGLSRLKLRWAVRLRPWTPFPQLIKDDVGVPVTFKMSFLFSLFLFYERLKARDPGYVHFFVFLDLNRFLSLFFSFFISFIHSTAIFLLEAVDEKKWKICDGRYGSKKDEKYAWKQWSASIFSLLPNLFHVLPFPCSISVTRICQWLRTSKT